MANSILLYRYMDSSAALRTIETRSFRVGRLREFNDPFEWRMGLTGIIPQGEGVGNYCLEAFISDANAWMGVLCFSDTVSDPVLWSHYADKHSGVAFEVDYAWEDGHLHKMLYTDERPVVNANRLNDLHGVDEYLKPLLEKLMKQKSSGWSYEHEYRVFISLDQCDVAGGHYFWPFPDNSLTRVIMGFRCPLEERYVRKLLDKTGLTSTQVVRAKLCSETYAVRC